MGILTVLLALVGGLQAPSPKGTDLVFVGDGYLFRAAPCEGWRMEKTPKEPFLARFTPLFAEKPSESLCTISLAVITKNAEPAEKIIDRLLAAEKAKRKEGKATRGAVLTDLSKQPVFSFRVDGGDEVPVLWAFSNTPKVLVSFKLTAKSTAAFDAAEPFLARVVEQYGFVTDRVKGTSPKG